MIKNFFKRILFFVLFIVAILLGITFFETQHDLDTYETLVGTSSNTSETQYEVTDWASHLAYLETFEYQGYNIRYLDRGKAYGEVIVLLHGTPTNSWLWRKIVPGLIGAGYRVIVPDMLGFGASSMPTHVDDIHAKKQSDILIALLDELEIDSFAIAGHDQGSLWTWETITKHSSRISHLVIFNSIGHRDGFHPPAGFGEENMSTKFTAKAMGSKPLGRIFAYGAMLGGLKNKLLATTTMIDGYLFPLLHGMSDTYFAFITSFNDIQNDVTLYQQAFPALQIPTLVLWGKYDKILVGEEQIPVLQSLLNIEDQHIHYLNAAHFVQEEVPDEIVEKMIDFLSPTLVSLK